MSDILHRLLKLKVGMIHTEEDFEKSSFALWN